VTQFLAMISTNLVMSKVVTELELLSRVLASDLPYLIHELFCKAIFGAFLPKLVEMFAVYALKLIKIVHSSLFPLI
jgi:hypothetical protein